MNHTTRKWSLRVVVIAYLGALVGLPVGFLFVKAFSHGWSTFWNEVTTPDAVAALKLSVEVAAIAVPVNTVIGIGAAVLLARRRFLGSRVLMVLFDVPVAVSPIIIGVALVLAYSRIGWFGGWLGAHGITVLFSPVGIVMATMAVSLPYVLRSVLPVLIEVGKDQEQAARTLGAGEWRVFFTITLPLAKRGILAGTLLAFARALGEFGATIMVAGNIPGRTTTLPVAIYQAVENGEDAHAWTLAGISAVIAFAAVFASERLQRRRR